MIIKDRSFRSKPIPYARLFPCVESGGGGGGVLSAQFFALLLISSILMHASPPHLHCTQFMLTAGVYVADDLSTI